MQVTCFNCIHKYVDNRTLRCNSGLETDGFPFEDESVIKDCFEPFETPMTEGPVERLVLCRGCGGEFDKMSFVVDSGLCAVCHDFMMKSLREAEKAERGDATTVDIDEAEFGNGFPWVE